MRSILIIILLISSIGIKASESIEETISMLSEKKFEWLINKQTDSLQRYLDDRLLYIHSNGMIETKDELIGNNMTGVLTYYAVEVINPHVRVENETAILTATCRLKAAMQGNSFEASLLFTEVYVFKNNLWQLISRHSSRMP